MKYWIVFIFCLAVVIPAFAQQDEVAALWEKFKYAETDTAKARLLDDLCAYYSYTDIDSAFILNKEASALARKHRHKDLESLTRQTLSGLYVQIGASQAAFEIQLELLEEATANNNLSFQQWLCNSISMNYLVNLGDLENGKRYAYKSMTIPGWEKQKMYCASTFLNLGDVYTRLSEFDSARHYLNKAYDLAKNLFGDVDNEFTTMIENNFGNLYLKMNEPEMALIYYQKCLPFALKTNYIDVLCESGMGMAKIYQKQQMQDSVLFYVNRSLAVAKQAKYLAYMLQSSNFLAEYYRETNQLDSAVKYFSFSSAVRDSLLDSEKVNKIKALELAQQSRAQKREQEEAEALEERRVNIHYAILLIGVVSFLMLALLLSRSFVVHHNFVRFLGVLSLLLVFEFINLYLHPLLDKLTGHSPIIMLLIMTGIASLLIPLHHKLEHWITHILVEKNKKIRLAQAKKVIQELESDQAASGNALE